jgi:hypothetical protein
VIGWVGEEFGARWTLIGGGAVALIGTVAAVIIFLRSSGLVIRAHVGRRPAMSVSPNGKAMSDTEGVTR